ncbi:ribonuclease III [Candidatus Nomurabacteria bacterium RIFCSPLOWO2_01_FULL_42_20]|uniref:Ribonuclease 3 n=1 Tax=Candidatus Nomurabacteria bacterium RIFCSPHIGHO2_01_FULL_42_16 TaxID=1801743 RepID=A0A1F6VHC6_9BACT|nr:MAG: ribonuclease III [Candidatus Nomurabacteria bacterium RIFCSPHIGHO2_01_FULL_42_16]OGI91174.1 MAG: ribonuclease III [Candidatus Nomurabacteria bacterium RIFCSPLOWO2_01_FULL_42_20]
MVDFPEFEKKVKITFKNKDLLKQAFVHRSYLNENPQLGIGHNERLEFLGDAVLELIVTNYLYNRYPSETEGAMTSYRSALVNALILSEIAAKLGISDYLMLSRGETRDTGRARQYILANTFEALIGAIYLDQGYETAEDFISRYLLVRVNEVVSGKLWQDSKSYVQEMAQEHFGLTPAYKVLSETGPDHDKQFTVGIYFGNELITKGKGKSKQEAEQQAAEKALKFKNWQI